MESVYINPTDETPKVVMDPTKDQFEISGRSLPEDVNSFYDPILDWLRVYGESPLEQTKVVFKMDYFNTASQKMILDILLRLRDIHRNGNKVIVSWYYHHDEEEMLENGDEFHEMTEIPFEYLVY